MEIFGEVWKIVRNYYAPTTTVPAVVKKTVAALNAAGHDAATAGRNGLIVDGEVFTIEKIKGWMHFEVTMHGVKC